MIIPRGAALWLSVFGASPESFGLRLSERLSEEYARAFSEDPVALMTMARKLSKLTATCAPGFSYISAAIRAIAHESYLSPSSVNFPQTPVTNWGLGECVKESHRDISANIHYHLLSNMEDVIKSGQDFAKLALPVAQRTFSGGERFSQSWRSALDLLVTLHERNLTSKESIEFLIAMYNKLSSEPTRGGVAPTALSSPGFGPSAGHGAAGVTSRDPLYVSAQVLARATMALLPKHDAHELMGLILVRLASEAAHDPELCRGILLEARQQFGKNPSNTFNLIALDLVLAAPIMSHAMFAITPSLYKMDPVATNVIAHMTTEIGCNESWALTSNIVRKYLWYNANKFALREEDSKRSETGWLTKLFLAPVDALSALLRSSTARAPSMSVELLAELAEAGVEEAEWALALRLEDDHPSKNNLLSFSAHKGRAAAQLNLARVGTENTVRWRRSAEAKRSKPPARARAAEEAESEEEQILEAWEHPHVLPLRLSESQLKLVNLELITESPSRWEGYDAERGSTFIAPYTESLLLQSWAAFFGRGRPQSLRDCLTILTRVPSPLVKYAYLALYQFLLVLNGILLKGKMVAVYMLYILAMSLW